MDATEGLQSYRGCDWTHDLAAISNPDKHRELHGTFAAQDGSFAAAIGSPNQIAGQPGKLQPVRGDPAGRYAKVHHEIAAFSVTFGDGGPGVAEILEILQSQVSQTLNAFKSEF